MHAFIEQRNAEHHTRWIDDWFGTPAFTKDGVVRETKPAWQELRNFHKNCVTFTDDTEWVPSCFHACFTRSRIRVETCSYDVYVCTCSWWWICTLRRKQSMCQKLFLWHVHDQNLPSIFAYMVVNMWMRYNEFYTVGTFSYDVYVSTCSRWWICTLRRVQLMCQKLFLWHVHDQKFPSIFLLILYNIYN